jgi:hypothetical protein
MTILFIYLYLLFRTFPELMLTLPVTVATRWVATWDISMKIKIGRRALSALPAVIRPTIFYDIDLTGFGALSCIVEYAGGRSISKRRMVIGTPKNLTPEEACNQASGILAGFRHTCPRKTR